MREMSPNYRKRAERCDLAEKFGGFLNRSGFDPDDLGALPMGLGCSGRCD